MLKESTEARVEQAERDGDRPTIKILGKTFHLLEVLADSDEPLSIVSLAKITKLNRTTVHRTVQVLLRAGYIAQAEGGSRFTVGPQTLPLAAKYLNQSTLRSVALSHLYPLTARTEMRGHLGIHVNDEVMYLGGFEKPQIPTIYTWFGRKAPMHCCSLGKVMLASMTVAEVERILRSRPLTRFTDTTITDPDILLEQLKEIRRLGYAFDDAEHIEGTYCMGVPIHSGPKVIASISIAAKNVDQVKEALPALVQTGETISQALSFV